jgi:hypothetical protein
MKAIKYVTILFIRWMMPPGIPSLFPIPVIAVAIAFAIVDAITTIIRANIVVSSNGLILPVKKGSSNTAITT